MSTDKIKEEFIEDYPEAAAAILANEYGVKRISALAMYAAYKTGYLKGVKA